MIINDCHKINISGTLDIDVGRDIHSHRLVDKEQQILDEIIVD